MKKKLMTVLALVLVIAMSVAGTYAYLTSQASVKNTFTVGKVAITLDEAKVNEYGQKLNVSGDVAAEGETLAARCYANEYKLVPGHEYTKDPTVHVAGGSEACYVFVKVEDGLNAIEVNDMAAEDSKEWTPNIANQITRQFGWTQLKDAQGNAVANVYYKEVAATESAVDLKVFNGFQLTDNAKTDDYGNANITVTAYAVQKDGFDNALAAWNATFGK